MRRMRPPLRSGHRHTPPTPFLQLMVFANLTGGLGENIAEWAKKDPFRRPVRDGEHNV
jgi:hypothetical protein